MHYLRKVWDARYFWWHLVLADLRARWRRSFFGAMWSVLQPLGMTLLLTVVFGKIFGVDFVRYAPYIYSGIIAWEFVGTSVTGGSLAFVQADAYIRQTKHPLAIYTLRNALGGLLIFALASSGLLLWTLLLFPENMGWCWLAAPLVVPILLVCGWGISTFLAYLATRFRDIPHGLGLVLQAVWFVSPVYFEPSVFKNAGLAFLVDWNPVYHVLEILRAPLLRGEWPSAANLGWSAGTALTCCLVAWIAGQRLEERTIFYL